MIVERLTFQAKYGHGDELVTLFKEWASSHPGLGRVRIYTDVTGTMFTTQFESEYESLAALAAVEADQRKEYETAAFQDWFGRMVAVTERGERQLLNVESI